MGAVPTFRAAVDIGGTFTDVVVATDEGRLAVVKRLSTPADYGEAVVEGVVAALGQLGLPASAGAEVLHATTIATNAILERAGAHCALITTEGFRDVLEIGRLRIPILYDLFYEKRPPLVRRRHVFEVAERIGHRGEVVTPLDPASVEAAIAGVLASGAESVAVCLINSYANPDHERRVAEALRARAPGLEVSVSSEILPQIGEYERTSTTAVNAYVKPVVRGYLRSFQSRLEGAGIAAPLYIMQSSGGLTSAERAAEQPVSLIESGPAAGVLAAGAVVAAGHANVLSFDMGGTSAKASIIEGGAVLKTLDYEVGGAISATTRLTGGGGYPIAMPVIDVAEVGAGGGSIAWIDDGGGLRVGPRSAGAQPGPACYGRGGAEPTVTDANVVLGYLNPDAIAGGVIRIDSGAAARAIVERVADPLGLDLMAAAHGIHLIVNSEMMAAIRAVSTQRGRDVRDFVLVAFGGCGPMHAALLARECGIATVIVPPSPGVFSSFGLLTTALEFQRGRMFYVDAAELDPGRLNRTLAELRGEVTAMATDSGGEGAISFEIEADFHYWGQSHELTVRMPFAGLDRARLEALAEAFEAEHERTFGHRAKGERIILVAARVTGRRLPALASARTGVAEAAAATAGVGRRRAYFGPASGFADCAVIGRAALTPAQRPGPLLIEEYDSVTVVPPGCSARLDAVGNIVVAIGPAAGTHSIREAGR